ncbi:MAG: hypothetical protein DLM53_00035 [Candidatus Eremiobacter antarcticus]|nr:MAG: hypothetical protein DLM53_00035 [Candidatus Eremiobacter sp. RRmetagenome_bin22]
MVCGYRPTPAGGGTEKYVYELSAGLLQRGVHVEIICEDRPFLPDAENLLAKNIVGVSPYALSGTSGPDRYWEKSRQFAHAIQPARYDLVHCHGQYGYHTALRWAQLARRPPLIATFHLTALGPIQRYRALGLSEPDEARVDRTVAIMEEAMGRLADRCIAVSQGVADELVELYGVPSDRVEPIHNWYDANVFRPMDQQFARAVLGLTPRRQYLLYVGHFNMARGKIMADVLRRLPKHITLVVVHHETDKAIVEEFGERVKFTGHLGPREMALHYCAADLLCFPALYGGFGLVLIESMACGCPPVVFNYSAMNEVVTGDSGYMVEEPSAAAYAAKIQLALAEGSAKSSAAMVRAKAFNMKTQIDAILDVYRDCVSPVSTLARSVS